MTTDTEVKPMDPELARQAANVLVDIGYANEPDELALRAIADGRHEVIDKATHEAVERSELERLRACEADARRYRWLRRQHWHDSQLVVVRSPKHAVKPGQDCPSNYRLDDAIDAAQQEQDNDR